LSGPDVIFASGCGPLLLYKKFTPSYVIPRYSKSSAAFLLIAGSPYLLI